MSDPFDIPTKTTECFCDNPSGNTREISTESVAVGPMLPVDAPTPASGDPYPAPID